MSDVDQRIMQCEKDLTAIQQNLQELKAQKRREGVYQFQSGDIVKMGDQIRIICNNSHKELISVCRNGCYCVTGQQNFEYFGYRKVGTLSALFYAKEI